MARLAEENRMQRESEGLALKQSKLDDPQFSGLPAAEHVAFWRSFQNRYPMVSVDLELGAALAKYKAELLVASNRALGLSVNRLESRLYTTERNFYRSRRYSGA